MNIIPLRFKKTFVILNKNLYKNLKIFQCQIEPNCCVKDYSTSTQSEGIGIFRISLQEADNVWRKEWWNEVTKNTGT